MKLPQTLFWLLAFITTIHALALPTAFESVTEPAKALWKRKGGGGGRGGGFSSGGSRGGGSSSSARESRLGSSTSNVGGRTSSGTGIQPRAYGSGAYYGGGARAPYKSGKTSPGGIAPVFLGGAALGFFPGVWLYGAYAYSYPHPYYYHNATSGQNETRPVECLCSRFQECGCDARNQTDYVNSVANNNTIARVADVNDTDTLVINGTLPNGTTVASAAGPGVRQGLLEMSGWWVVLAGVGYAVWFF